MTIAERSLKLYAQAEHLSDAIGQTREEPATMDLRRRAAFIVEKIAQGHHSNESLADLETALDRLGEFFADYLANGPRWPLLTK